jgi:hypothetical protein
MIRAACFNGSIFGGKDIRGESKTKFSGTKLHQRRDKRERRDTD